MDKQLSFKTGYFELNGKPYSRKTYFTKGPKP